MALKLAFSCLLGGSLLFVSAVPANLNGHARAHVGAPKLRGSFTLANLAPPADARESDEAPQAPLQDDDADAAKDAPPTSLERARAALAGSNAPTLSDHDICTRLVAVAQANALPVGFFANLIWRESNFDRAAISRVGAMGIAQFMPDVADRLGVDAFDPRDALPASGQLLRTLRTRFGNLGLVAATYNAGPKRVSDWLQQRGGLPQETRDYVSIITGKPAEEWRGAKAAAVVFQVPRQVPCHRTPAFSLLESAERAAQLRELAEQQKLLRKARVAARSQKKKPRATVTASRGRTG